MKEQKHFLQDAHNYKTLCGKALAFSFIHITSEVNCPDCLKEAIIKKNNAAAKLLKDVGRLIKQLNHAEKKCKK